jgi:hypothetical protein
MSLASCQWSILVVPLPHVVVKQSSAALHARDAADPTASPGGPSSPLLHTKLRRRGMALVGLGADLIFSAAVLTATFILLCLSLPIRRGSRVGETPGFAMGEQVGALCLQALTQSCHPASCITRCSALGEIAVHEGQSHAPSQRHYQASLPIPSLSGGAENLAEFRATCHKLRSMISSQPCSNNETTFLTKPNAHHVNVVARLQLGCR